MESSGYKFTNYMKDLSAIKVLLIITVSILSIVLLICIFLVFDKSGRLTKIYRRRFGDESMENTVVGYQKNVNEMQPNDSENLNIFS